MNYVVYGSLDVFDKDVKNTVKSIPVESIKVKLDCDRHPNLVTAITSTHASLLLAYDRIKRSKSEAIASQLPGGLAGFGYRNKKIKKSTNLILF